MPNLSIVIPSYNRPDLLRACLQTVTDHAPQDTEIVVVDDASPDGAIGAVAADFQGVHCVRMSRRRGFCVAINAGIAATSGEIVELLNDDTEVTPGWAEAGLAPFRDNAVGAVAPLVLRWPGTSGDRIDSAGDRYYVGGVAGKRCTGQRLDASHLQPCQVFGASGSSAFYRRVPLKQIGGFPDSFGAYFEDVDVAFRLHWAGYRVVHQPTSRVLHHVSASYGRPRRRLLEQQSRNEELVFWRNVPGCMLRQALLHHAAVLAAKAWRRWSEGALTPFICGRLRALGEAAAVARHRRQLHQAAPSPPGEDWQLDPCFWNR